MRFRELKLRRNPECPVCGEMLHHWVAGSHLSSCAPMHGYSFAESVKLIEGHTSSEVIDEDVDGHTRADKHRRPTHDLGVGVIDLRRFHDFRG